MKILVISPDPDRPEAHLLAGIARAGNELVWMGSRETAHREVLMAAGSKFLPLRLPRKISLQAIRAIRTAVKVEKPDIVHSFTGRALSNALLACSGLKVSHVAYRGTMGHLSRWDPTSWITFLNPALKKIVCVSRAVSGYLEREGIKREKLITIYKGHDVSWYSGPPISLSKWIDDPSAFLLGCSANMRRVKGVDILVRAHAKVPRELNVHLILIGEIRDEEIGREISRSPCQNRIHILGYRRDAVSLLASCHAQVMASREREGLPKAVIEGMANGVAPIVTNVGGMPELVVDNECGFVVPPNDDKALALAIERFARDRALTKTFGQRARERIQTHFNVENTVKAHLEMYAECLSSSH